MTARVGHISSMLERYPTAHRAAKYAYHALKYVYRVPAAARRPYQIRKYLTNVGNFTGLQIGASSHQFDGWLVTDIDPDLKHVYLDATKRFPFANGTFNCIVAEHMIEHISYEDALRMLQECYRVLKGDGVIRITTPNLEFTHQLMHFPLTPALKRYVAYSNRRFGGADYINSATHVVNRLHHGWGHQFLYDRDTLAASLRQAGFAKIVECTLNESNHPALINIDSHADSVIFAEIGEELYGRSCLIVEAIK
jgi:SAM-dependent methyltransferase